jgi:hypothetical protein
VDCMPGDVSAVAPLASRVQRRVLQHAVVVKDPAPFLATHSTAVKALVREVRDGYTFAVKHAILAYQNMGPQGRQRLEGLRVALPEVVNRAREYGMVRGWVGRWLGARALEEVSV